MIITAVLFSVTMGYSGTGLLFVDRDTGNTLCEAGIITPAQRAKMALGDPESFINRY